MGYLIFHPTKHSQPITEKTTNQLVDQTWQEFVMLRYVKGKLIGRKSIIPWIDQAKTYFLDAQHINWRSAGLLYYYSFLNLAKALLVAKRKFSYKSLDTTSIYHGLRANLQDITNLIDYEIQISPLTVTKGGRTSSNVYSHFYQVVTGTNWPFSQEISIKLGDVLGYSLEIATKCQKLFNIERRIITIQSLFREVGNEAWFEMVVPDTQIELVKSQLTIWPFEILESSQLSQIDKMDWLTAYPMIAYAFTNNGVRIFRSKKKQFGVDNKIQVRNLVFNEVKLYLDPFAKNGACRTD